MPLTLMGYDEYCLTCERESYQRAQVQADRDNVRKMVDAAKIAIVEMGITDITKLPEKLKSYLELKEIK